MMKDFDAQNKQKNIDKNYKNIKKNREAGDRNDFLHRILQAQARHF
jgi:hypothetical protein